MKILTIGSISLEISDLEAIFSDEGELTIKVKNCKDGLMYKIGKHTFDYSKISDIIIEAESQYSNYHIRILSIFYADKFKNVKELDYNFCYVIEGSKF